MYFLESIQIHYNVENNLQYLSDGACGLFKNDSAMMYKPGKGLSGSSRNVRRKLINIRYSSTLLFHGRGWAEGFICVARKNKDSRAFALVDWFGY